MQEKKQKKILVQDLKKHPILKDYIKLVSYWSTKINLLSKEDSNNPNLIWERHVYNSYILKNYIDQYTINKNPYKSIYDLGSGAGFPGIVLAILDNKNHYYLVEKNNKKSSFLIFIKNSLQLNNITIINDDINLLDNSIAYILISRALTKLSNLAIYSNKLLKPQGCGFFIKGEAYKKEIEDMNKTNPSNIFTIKAYQPIDKLTTIIHLTKN